jgi:putative membrane protein
MRIIVGALWLILFVVLFAFAVNNTAPTELHFFAGMSVKAPLIAILLAFFVGGFVFGFIALMPAWVRQRVALRRLRRSAPVRPVPAAGPGRARATNVETADEIQSVAHVARTTN